MAGTRHAPGALLALWMKDDDRGCDVLVDEKCYCATVAVSITPGLFLLSPAKPTTTSLLAFYKQEPVSEVTVP